MLCLVLKNLNWGHWYHSILCQNKDFLSKQSGGKQITDNIPVTMKKNMARFPYDVNKSRANILIWSCIAAPTTDFLFSKSFSNIFHYTALGPGNIFFKSLGLKTNDSSHLKIELFPQCFGKSLRLECLLTNKMKWNKSAGQILLIV